MRQHRSVTSDTSACEIIHRYLGFFMDEVGGLTPQQQAPNAPLRVRP
jgi:hypothetical protein